MTKQNERIETLRKEKLRNNFNQLGISSEFVDNFSIRLTKKLSDYSNYDLNESIKKSLVNQVKKQLQNITQFDELKNFLETISFGSSKITIESIGAMEDKEISNYLSDLLFSCGKLSRNDLKDEKIGTLSMFEKMAHFLPVEVKVNRINSDGREKESIGYSLANISFKKRYHNHSWYLTRSKIKTSTLIFDLSTLVADVFFSNSIEQFTLKNIEFYEYKAAEKYAINAEGFYSRNKSFPLPTNELFRAKLLDILNKFEMLIIDVEMVPNEYFNQYEEDFIIKTNEEQTVVLNMTHYMASTMTREFVKQTSYIKEKVDREIKGASDYARSFQTKKNINKQTLAAMENNKFLAKYGYVEIDNDVSLEKFSALEKEYEQLMTMISIPRNSEGSFRIKKLGHHRAAGLYYSSPVRATIFDLDSPDAYCHELAHQIDDTWSEKGMLLSETILFRKIKDMYETLTEKAVELLGNDHPFKKLWNGNTKYNASYYLQPTEIFARSFELYLWNKGIQTSFLKKEYSGAEYPKEEGYLKALTMYFDELFAKINEAEPKNELKSEISLEQMEQTSEKPKHVATPSTICINKTADCQEVLQTNQFEQLSLF